MLLLGVNDGANVCSGGTCKESGNYFEPDYCAPILHPVRSRLGEGPFLTSFSGRFMLYLARVFFDPGSILFLSLMESLTRIRSSNNENDIVALPTEMYSVYRKGIHEVQAK